MQQPLAGLRVVELATGVAGPFAGKLLADFGADVIKVEPPGGDPTRAFRFDPGDDEDPETGPLFLHLNANKRSIVADPANSPADRELVARLAAGADVVLESFQPHAMAGWGLGPDELRRHRPQLVVVQLTPWGQHGPLAGEAGNDLAVYALAGPMNATGIDEREPMKMAGRTIAYQAGTVAATAALAAVTRAAATGRGATVDAAMVDAQLGSIDRRVTYLLYRQFSGLDAPRAPASTQQELPAGVFPAADGHVQAHTIPSWVPGMLATLDDPELTARYAADDGDADLPGLTEAAFYLWLAGVNRREAMVRAQANRWPITAINAPIDLLDDPHFAGRGSFVEVDHPVAGRYRTIGAPWRVTDGWQLRRAAPLLDADRAEVLAELGDIPAGTPAIPVATRRPEPAADRLPLDGLRVLDLTVVWAGPYCTMLLADLGADVVRVDNPWLWPTATRGVVPRPPRELVPALGPLGAYPDLDPGPRPWNRHSMYSAHARNKRGVTLDLRTEVGRELFLRMVEQADVLVENNSAKVLDQLGVGWDVLHARNPRLIAVRMAPLGLSGPYRDFIGFGVHFEGLCGATAVRGYRDADPGLTWATFHMDPASGAAAAFAVMASLRRRERTGTGELIEFAQAENLMNHLGEYYIDAARHGRTHHSPGNRDPHLAPQGCYRAADGTHLVLTVTDDAAWPHLAARIGAPELAGLDRRGRLAAHDLIDEHLAAWAATMSAADAVAACRAAGAVAAPVLGEAACLGDEHLLARGAFRPNGSSDLGQFLFPGHVFRWDGPPLRWEPLCRLGADNAAVYREWLGLDDAELAALDAAGQLSEDYRKPDGTAW